MPYLLGQSNENLTSHSGLVLSGALLSKTRLSARFDVLQAVDKKTYDISHADVVSSYLGLLTLGRNDFEHIEPFREDAFFRGALSCENVPSAPTLRQRLDQQAGEKWEAILREESADLLKNMQATLTPAIRNLVPLDGDVSAFDNSGTKKEGVEYTYKKFDGYAPMFFYLGKEGYQVDLEFRKGSTHCQDGTSALLERAIGQARRVTNAPLLVRLDAGNDALDNIKVLLKTNQRDQEDAHAGRTEYIIKRNLRLESKENWRKIAEETGALEQPRPGKKIWIGDIETEREGVEKPLRMVFRVIERTIDKKGQMLLEPELEVATWWTSLADDPETVIELYKGLGTMEQFHSEIKSELDLDLERLPSGKFATNSLVLHLGMMAYNMLRLIGQESLKAVSQPVRKKVTRRRIRTVIQNLMTVASRVTKHARREKLAFGKYSPWYPVFRRVYFAFIS